MDGKSTKTWKSKWPLLIFAVLFVISGCASNPQAKPPLAPAEPKAQQGKAILQIDVSEDRTTTRVSIHSNKPLTYTAIKHQFPLGVVLYFPETNLKGIQKSYTPKSTLIKTIHASELERKRPSSRIEIRLNEDVSYKVRRDENEILVAFNRPVDESELVDGSEKEAEPDKIARPEPKIITSPAPPATASAPKEAKERTERPALVKRIDFEMLQAGKSRLTIETDKKISYESQKSSDKKLLLKLLNTKIPEFQRRQLITTRFKSAIDRILPLQSERMGNTAVIAIELREAIPYRIYQKENACIIDFEASDVPPRPMPEAEKPRWIQAMKEAQAAVLKKEEKEPEKQVLTKSGKKYTGERISLDFQDADIHNIFRILHEVSGKNFVIGEDVKGNVTLKLVNVPWDQVLALILKMNKLGTVEEGNIVRIAMLSTLGTEQEALAKKAKADQQAKILEPLITKYIKLDYADASSVITHLNEIKSDRGKITVDKPTNMIIIKDDKEALADAEELIAIGIQWGGDYSASGHDGNATITTDLFGAGGVGGASNATPNFAVDLPPASATSGLGFTFGRIGGTVLNLDIRLLAMEENGKGRTISAPKILTLDNKKATIKQVTKIPFQVTADNTTSIETEEAGIELSVTPQITRDNRIRMTIFAEKGAPDWSHTVMGNPAIDTNTAETELFVNDGQTIVIGGILTTTDSLSQAGVPWLSKIPFLGWLFKQKKTVKTKNELLIFITPKIIKLEEAARIYS
ncbi:MAG: secretin and TonB N-terminal domain-containing protein [Deltaproteobacteria bacterium]|nr:secretin and TonB N-terminal domain-containing protein [Deltaproteobacteria bacterium]